MYLRKENIMEKVKSHKRSIAAIIAIIVIVISVSIYVWNSNLKETNKRVIRAAKEVSLDTKEEREKGIEKLKNLLEEAKYLDVSNRIRLLNKISLLYLMNSDYENGLDYSVEAIYLSEKQGDAYSAAKSLIDMSNVFAELNQYDFAEEIVTYALGFEIKDSYKDSMIKYYGYMNLADIYSENYRSKEAIEYADKALEYLDKENSIYENSVFILNVIKARANFYSGNIVQCRNILNYLESNKEKFQGKMVGNVEIPFLALRAKLEAYDGNIEKAIEFSNEMLELCDEEGLIDSKKKNMDYIMQVLHRHYDKSEANQVYVYEHKLLGEYHNIINNKNEMLARFMMTRFQDKYKDMKAKENSIKLVIQAIVIITMSMMLGATSIYVRRYKIQTEVDELTGVYNRRKFDYDYKKLMLKNKKFGLIIIDIDHFKSFNDNYGHDFGDVVLRNVIKLMKNRLSKDEEIYRYGGEEFCILCTGKELQDIVHLAETIRKDVESMTWREGVQVTISSGIACNGQNGNLFKLADENLYKSKENGRNRVTY